MSDFNGISGASFGSISSSLGSYNGNRSSSGGSGGGGNRSNQFESLNLTDFVDTDVEDYTHKDQADLNDLDARMDKLRESLNGWRSVRDSLLDTYEQEYGKGIEITNKEGIDYFFTVLNILRVQDLLEVGHLNGIFTFNGPYLTEEFTGRVIDVVNEYDLIDKLESYLKGASWEASGLASIYGADGESNFVFGMAEQCYSVEFDEQYYFESPEDLNYDLIKKGCLELFLLNDPNLADSPYKTLEDLTAKVEDVRILHADINQVSAKVYDLEQVEKLLPFTYVVDLKDFSGYLDRDYANNPNIPNRLKENLNQEEMAIYTYLKEHEGQGKADDYIKAMEDQINRRIGMRNAANFVESMSKNGLDVIDFFHSSGVGFYDGTKNFFDGLKDFFMADGVMNAFEYETMYKMMYLAETNEFNSQLTNAEREFLKFNYQSWQSIGNMWIPSAVAFIPVVGKPLSSTLMFTSTAGNATEGAMQQGIDPTTAYLYGCLSGLSEVTFERILGGIPGLSNMGESFIVNTLKEGGEEFLQEWIDAGLRWMILKEPVDLQETFGNSLYAALQGMAVSGLMQGGQKLAFKVGDSIVYWSDSEYNSLTEMLSGMNVKANGEIANSELMSKILDMDSGNPLKSKLVSLILETELITDPQFLAELDSETIEQLHDYLTEEGYTKMADALSEYLQPQNSIETTTLKMPIDEIVNLDLEARKEMLQNLTPEEIAIGLENLNQDSYRTIMDSLSKDAKLKVIYAQAALAAQGKYRGFFMNFREHAELHTNEVRDYAVAIALKVPGINVNEVYYGAQFHDLGMRGGVFELNGKYVPIDSLTMNDLTMDDLESYIRNSNGWGKIKAEEMDIRMREKYGIEDWSSNKDMSKIPQEVVDMAFSNKLAEIARSNHPLNSAIAILTEDVTPDGVDKNIVALLAMTHSKSTSGIRNFDSITEWGNCIEKLKSALIDSGMDINEVNTITSGLYDAINNPDTFQRLIDEALCIRDGDAMSVVPLVNGDTLMQDGNTSHVDYTGKAQLSGYSDLPTTPAAEQAGIIDTLYDANGNKIGTVENLFSKKTHAGELNVTFDSTYDGSSYSATAKITDPTKAPFSSLDSAFERAGEVATYSNCSERVFEIELPAEMEGTPLAEWYVAQIDEMARAEIQKAKDKGYSSQQLIDFYNNSIKVVYR